MESSKKIVVDEGGNKRTEISLDDFISALHDIEQWYKTNAPAYYDKYLKDRKTKDLSVI